MSRGNKRMKKEDKEAEKIKKVFCVRKEIIRGN